MRTNAEQGLFVSDLWVLHLAKEIPHLSPESPDYSGRAQTTGDCQRRGQNFARDDIYWIAIIAL